MDADQDYLWINEQLRRLGCAEIVLVGATEREGAVFHRECQTIRCNLSSVYSVLFSLPDNAGDDLVWSSLRRNSELTLVPPWARDEEPTPGPRAGS